MSLQVDRQQLPGGEEQVAKKHYLQTTDERFDRAVEGGALAAQNRAQQPQAQDRTDSQSGSDKRRNPLFSKRLGELLQSVATRREKQKRKCMGIEPTGDTVHIPPNGFEDRGPHQRNKHFQIFNSQQPLIVSTWKSGHK